MDMQDAKIECTLDGVTTHGMVVRRDLPKNERLKRAGKIFGVFFGIAFLTVFVPILHFILPPLSLFTGGFLGWNEYRNQGEILEGKIDCPNCKKTIEFIRGGEHWPRVQRCPHCSLTLTILPPTATVHSNP